jgi:hypothetical protein
MCLNEAYSKFQTGKNLSRVILVKNYLKQGDAISLLLSNFVIHYVIRKVQETRKDLYLNGTN